MCVYMYIGLLKLPAIYHTDGALGAGKLDTHRCRAAASTNSKLYIYIYVRAPGNACAAGEEKGTAGFYEARVRLSFCVLLLLLLCLN